MDIDRVPVPDFYPDVEEVRSDIADYNFEVERWDSDVMAALKLLQEAGAREHGHRHVWRPRDAFSKMQRQSL